MPDPFDRLRVPIVPVEPPDEFRRALRRRIADALALPATTTPPAPDTPTDPRRTPMATSPAPTRPVVTAITPYLTTDDAAAAIDFYVAAFGAVEEMRVVGDDGRIGHAELRIGDARIQLSDEYPEIDVRAPRSLGGAAAAFSLTVTDCDGTYRRAVTAGADGVRPPADESHGNRMAVVRDPFGHRWNILQPVETLDVDAYAARLEGSEFRVVAGAHPDGAPAAARTSPDGIWPALHYRDARAAIRFAVDVLGFEEALVVTDDADPAVVHHSELRWPEGGIVQIASAGDGLYSTPPGVGVLYVITLDPEAVLARCEAAGADIADPLVDVDYGRPGDRNFTVRDAEGTLWCFGTYGAVR